MKAGDQYRRRVLWRGREILIEIVDPVGANGLLRTRTVGTKSRQPVLMHINWLNERYVPVSST